MNAEQRKRLETALGQIQEARAVIEAVRDENQDSFDNMPEGLQQAEKGDQMQSAIDNLESAASELESVESYIEEASQ